MKNLKENYIKLIRERSDLLQTAWLYPSHYEEAKKLDKEIEKLVEKMKERI